jgi:DnaK suppressor protein
VITSIDVNPRGLFSEETAGDHLSQSTARVFHGGNMEVGSEQKGTGRGSLRTMLLMKRGEIEAFIRKELAERITEDLDSVVGPALDAGDLSTYDLGRDVDYELLTMHTEALKDIDEALERLDEGTYGICEECGEEIGEKRLKAIPFALCCLECQEEKERSKGTGY